ncbi:head GIN domain-containing protein [Flaviaesturariibacter amylovorans]|uniref:Putative auto-transporter adhesin head GIN domain-containing protein n=1 Tax=Flaviaesturariibacter amylovorans TaxID=1084520 RepID=A0ABP8GIN1_9BACT
MKKLFTVALLAVCAVAGAQKTINDPNAQLRTVSSFHGVKVSSGIDLYLSPGDEAVAVSARDAEYRDRILTKVENGVLHIWYDHKGMSWSNGNKALKAYVSYKALDQVDASGGSDVLVDGTIRANKLSVNLSGGSDFKGAVAVQQMKVDQSGGSDMTVSGTAGTLRVDASGGSDFKGYGLSAESCTAEASGGSDIDVQVSKEIRAHASGGSDISYRGNPSVVETNKSGGSSVKKSGK